MEGRLKKGAAWRTKKLLGAEQWNRSSLKADKIRVYTCCDIAQQAEIVGAR